MTISEANVYIASATIDHLDGIETVVSALEESNAWKSDDKSNVLESIREQIKRIEADWHDPYINALLTITDREGSPRYTIDDIAYEMPEGHILFELQSRLDAICPSTRNVKCMFYPPTDSLECLIDNNLLKPKCGKDFAIIVPIIDIEHFYSYFLFPENSNVDYLISHRCSDNNNHIIRYISDVIEIDGDSCLILVIKEGTAPNTANAHYIIDGCSYLYQFARSCLHDSLRPKFFFLESSHVPIGGSETSLLGPDPDGVLISGRTRACGSGPHNYIGDLRACISGMYYYIDYYEQHAPDRHFQGDSLMKACISRTTQSINEKSRFHKTRITYSPSIIVDLDRHTAIAYYLVNRDGEHLDTPFVLDDHFAAYTLSEDFLPDTPDFKRYRIATDKINKHFGEHINEIGTELKIAKGLPYHLSQWQKQFILDFNGGAIIDSRKKPTSQQDILLPCLTPCGFNLKPYLDKLCENDSFLRPERDNRGRILRYSKVNKISDATMVLFAFIMNARIAEEYEKSENKELMDYWYMTKSWFGDAESKVKTKVTRWKMVNNVKGVNDAESHRIYTYIDTGRKNEDNKLTVEYRYVMRSLFFEKLLSMKPDTIRTLKSNAIMEPNANASHGERQDLIRAIKSVDEEILNCKSMPGDVIKES